MNQGDEGDNSLEKDNKQNNFPINAYNENALIVVFSPDNAQQVHEHAAENTPVNGQGIRSPPELQDEAPVAHMVHAVPNFPHMPQGYQPNPEPQDEAPVGGATCSEPSFYASLVIS